MHGSIPKKDSIQELAASCLQEANNDAIRATDDMTRLVLDSPKLYKSLMDPLVREACYNAIRQLIRQNRGRIWESPQPSAADERRAVQAAARGVLHGLYRFPLPGGILLGDAGKEDVLMASRFYGTQSRDMGVKERWLSLVANALPEDKLVKECLSPSKLAMLRKKAGWEERTNED